jgi:hypothetical protein
VTHSEYEHELRESIKRQAKREAEGDPIYRIRTHVPTHLDNADLGVVWGKRRPVN